MLDQVATQRGDLGIREARPPQRVNVALLLEPHDGRQPVDEPAIDPAARRQQLRLGAATERHCRAISNLIGRRVEDARHQRQGHVRKPWDKSGHG